MSRELLEKYIESGNDSGLAALLLSNPELAMLKTSHQVSPLMLSCYYKKPSISNIILGYIPDPDIYESSALGKFDSVANIVYKHPELINTFSDDGFTPLGLACFFGHEEIARYLLLKGAEVNVASRNDFHVYPLHSAVAADNADITKILLEAGAETNVLQQSKITPLHSAAHNGNIEIIILLLEAGSDVKARMDNGKTPADMASDHGFKDIARILAE
jgi:ankyrin repeat protein